MRVLALICASLGLVTTAEARWLELPMPPAQYAGTCGRTPRADFRGADDLLNCGGGFLRGSCRLDPGNLRLGLLYRSR